VTRLLGPDDRAVYTPDGRLRAQGYTVVVYADLGATVLADVLTEAGAAVPGSALTVNAYSRIPLFRFPDGVDTVYAVVNGGPVTPLYARVDDRVDALTVRVDDLEAGDGGDLAAHEADTTAVHGIADTALLVAANSVRVTPETFGAKRDGRTITDAAITEADNTLTSASAGFTAGDVGKIVAVTGAGANATKNTLVTTIASVTNATTVELAAPAAVTVTGARATYGTDDTVAVQAALNAAVAAGQANGTHYAEVVFSAGQYMIAGPLLTGAPYYGHAQLRLPVIPEAGQKFTLVLLGTAEGAAFAHWMQTVPQTSGAVLRSTLLGAVSDGTWGPPACLGGPTRADLGGGFDAGWSNMLLVVDGLTILGPRDPTFTALYAVRVAQLHVATFAALADRTPTEMHAVKPVNDGGLGLAVPRVSNNDYVVIGSYACEGWYYGMTLTDHLTAVRVAIIYCRVAMGLYGVGAANEHGASIVNASVEDCDTAVEAVITPGGRFPLMIGQLNTELAAGTAFIDAGNGLVGQVGYTANDASAPTVTGCGQWRIIDLNRFPGVATAPGVPASTVALRNPFWRDAAVHIAGGTVTVIAVDGQTLGVTSGLVIVPTGKTITLTYSVAPTWKWTLL